MEDTFIATFVMAERSVNTPDGNPQWVVTTSIGGFRTEKDADVANNMLNYVNPMAGDDYLIMQEVRFTIRGNRIIRMEKAL